MDDLAVDFVEVARAEGRGRSVFRPLEAAAFLGVHRQVVDDACSEWVTSKGRHGLPHFLCGKGTLIRREALGQWMQAREMAQAGRF